MSDIETERGAVQIACQAAIDAATEAESTAVSIYAALWDVEDAVGIPRTKMDPTRPPTDAERAKLVTELPELLSKLAGLSDELGSDSAAVETAIGEVRALLAPDSRRPSLLRERLQSLLKGCIRDFVDVGALGRVGYDVDGELRRLVDEMLAAEKRGSR